MKPLNSYCLISITVMLAERASSCVVNIRSALSEFTLKLPVMVPPDVGRYNDKSGLGIPRY